MIVLVLLLKTILIFLCVALAVGFYTLVERKVLSYIQIRKGPNKVGPRGLFQPLGDAIKLFSKETVIINLSNKVMYMARPVVSVVIIFFLWSLYTSPYSVVYLKLGLLFFLVVSRLNVYPILGSGWASNSKYALLGSIRAVAQTISYEVSIALMILSLLIVSVSFNFLDIYYSQVFL